MQWPGDPVIQSIVSSTSLLRGQLVKCFTTLWHWYCLLKRWDKLLRCKSFSHFFNKKYLRISDNNVWNFRETLTNGVVSFEQPCPDILIHLSRLSWYSAAVIELTTATKKHTKDVQKVLILAAYMYLCLAAYEGRSENSDSRCIHVPLFSGIRGSFRKFWFSLHTCTFV